MKKKLFKTGLVLMSSMALGAAILPTTITLASEPVKESQSVNQNTDISLSDTTTTTADQYINFNSDLKKFIISDELKSLISETEFLNVVNQVNSTNEQIKESTIKADRNTQISVVDSNGESTILKSALTRGAGRNYINYYWNFARIGISAGALRGALGVGFAIGSVYAPAKIVQAACAIAGLGTGNIKHGVWFDYNYFIGVLTGNAGLQ